METDKRTVVVKGINYAWTKADFENAFSDVGPIRKCFLVEEKGSKRHKVTCTWQLVPATWANDELLILPSIGQKLSWESAKSTSFVLAK